MRVDLAFHHSICVDNIAGFGVVVVNVPLFLLVVVVVVVVNVLLFLLVVVVLVNVLLFCWLLLMHCCFCRLLLLFWVKILSFFSSFLFFYP